MVFHVIYLKPMHIDSCIFLCSFGKDGDEFTSALVRIHATIEKEGGPRQPMCLAINRSDYMLHAPQDGRTTPHLLQVSKQKLLCCSGQGVCCSMVDSLTVTQSVCFLLVSQSIGVMGESGMLKGWSGARFPGFADRV